MDTNTLGRRKGQVKKKKGCLLLDLWPSGKTECPSVVRYQREQWGRSWQRRWAGAVGESEGNLCEEASGNKRPNLLFQSHCSFLDGSRTNIYGSGRANFFAGGGNLLGPRRLATTIQSRFLIFGLAAHTKHYPSIADTKQDRTASRKWKRSKMML